jgi:hypothetical protein
MAKQSLPYGDLNNIQIPLVVNSDQGIQISFSLDVITDLPSNINVYLDDSATNTSTLLNIEDYTITPNVRLNGAGRFYLRLTDNSLSTIDNELDNLQIFAVNNSIIIKGSLTSDTNMQLFDVQGRVVKTLELDTTVIKQTVNVSNLQDGIYIISLNGKNQRKTQKIILN